MALSWKFYIQPAQSAFATTANIVMLQDWQALFFDRLQIIALTSR
jgi:hypothetical protein